MTTTLQSVELIPSRWTTVQKILFRFLFVYFVLFCFPFPVVSFQLTQPITYPYMAFMLKLVPKVGMLFFDMKIENPIYGSRAADSSFGLAYHFIHMVVALLITFFWSIADRRRINYERLNVWFLLYIRYYLAFTLLSYGMNKVFPLQGGFITASVLEKPLGMMDPGELQWKFLAYSNVYKIFTGLGEVIGALLILWRRTATLGAMLLVAVLSVVVMLNFCFHIGVKISSLHYLFIAFLIIWNDRTRLLNLFLLNRSVSPISYTPLIRSFFWSRLFSVFLISLVVCRLYQLTDRNNTNWKLMSNFSQKPLYGTYTSEYFIRGIDTIPPLQTDSLRWKKLTIETMRDVSRVYIHLSTDSLIQSRTEIDTLQKTIQFQIRKDTLNMAWSLPDANHLHLAGKWKNESIKVMMKKYDLNNYPLHRERFQWISD